MAKRNEVFPSRYLKEADLGGKPLEVEVERAPQEELGSGDDKDEKTVLYFRGMTKVLPLNITNWDSVADIAGDDTVDWPGARLSSTRPQPAEGQDCPLHPYPRAAAEGAVAEEAPKPPRSR